MMSWEETNAFQSFIDIFKENSERAPAEVFVASVANKSFTQTHHNIYNTTPNYEMKPVAFLTLLPLGKESVFFCGDEHA